MTRDRKFDRSPILLLPLLCLIALTGAAQAQLYKWVDENGQTHYSEKPPAGGKSQELKTQPPPTAANPDSAPASAGSSDQPVKGKGKRGKSIRTETAAPSDAKRLEGDWATGKGARVNVHFVFSDPSDNEIWIGQQWTIGGSSQVDSLARYSIAGSGGRGSMNARKEPSPHTPDVPAQIGYRLDGEALVLSVRSGLYAGEHTLRRK